MEFESINNKIRNANPRKNPNLSSIVHTSTDEESDSSSHVVIKPVKRKMNKKEFAMDIAKKAKVTPRKAKPSKSKPVIIASDNDSESTLIKSEDKTDTENTEAANILVKRIDNTATIPLKTSAGAAGFDLVNPSTINIPPASIGIVQTKVAIAIPKDHYGQIAMRSGISKQKKLMILGGILDSDFRGEIVVMCYNGSIHKTAQISHGERFAQIIISKIHPSSVMVEVAALSNTERGEKGFGSSGI